LPTGRSKGSSQAIPIIEATKMVRATPLMSSPGAPHISYISQRIRVQGKTKATLHHSPNIG